MQSDRSAILVPKMCRIRLLFFDFMMRFSCLYDVDSISLQEISFIAMKITKTKKKVAGFILMSVAAIASIVCV